MTVRTPSARTMLSGFAMFVAAGGAAAGLLGAPAAPDLPAAPPLVQEAASMAIPAEAPGPTAAPRQVTAPRPARPHAQTGTTRHPARMIHTSDRAEPRIAPPPERERRPRAPTAMYVPEEPVYAPARGRPAAYPPGITYYYYPYYRYRY